MDCARCCPPVFPRKAQERISELQYELEASRDREVAKHELLNRVMVQVCVCVCVCVCICMHW